MSEKVNAGISGGMAGAGTGAAIGTMAGGPGMGTAIGAGVGAAVGFAAGLFGGGGSSESGLTLLPEQEFAMLEQSWKAFDQMKADYERAQTMFKTYEDRFNTISKGMEANIPSEKLRSQLATSTAKIALASGKSMEQLIADGMITKEAKADFDRLREIESQDFRDPRYDQARGAQKQQLMQNLQRQGASPAAINQAMAQFENETAIGAFAVAQELRTQEAGRITGRMGLQQDMRVSNQGILQSILGMQMSNLQGYSNMATQVAGVAQQGFGAAAAGLEYNRVARSDRQGLYNQLGEFKMSKDARAYSASGIPQDGNTMTTTAFKTRDKLAKQTATWEQLYKTSGHTGATSGYNRGPSAANAIDKNKEKLDAFDAAYLKPRDE
jgi:hypothetical protein